MSIYVSGRIEVKHAVPENIAAQALDWARPFLPPDRGLAGMQRITSMYLDSPELTFYRWHRERQAHRFKLRVRAYGDRPSGRVFAEVKEKHGSVRRKHRVALSTVGLNVLLTDDGSRGICPPESTPALWEFIARQRAYTARPRLLVSDLREALREPRGAGEVAVTVDREIVYQTTDRAAVTGDPERWRPVPLPWRMQATAILELKYAGHVPPEWMATLLRQIRPYRVSFSKYAAAIRQDASRSPW